jgi:hypothetical protein
MTIETSLLRDDLGILELEALQARLEDLDSLRLSEGERESLCIGNELEALESERFVRASEPKKEFIPAKYGFF